MYLGLAQPNPIQRKKKKLIQLQCIVILLTAYAAGLACMLAIDAH